MVKRNSKMMQRFTVAVLALVSLLVLLPATNAHAAEYYQGYYGWVVGSGSCSVYANSDLTSRIGSVSTYEGVTVLSENANSYYIEYSISSSPGYKRGYVSKSRLYTEPDETCLGKVTSSTTVYYGKGTTANGYQSAGSVSSGEYVSVLADDGTWTYIEYNTLSGRKRGYIARSALTIYNKPSGMKPYYKLDGNPYTTNADKSCTIYAGPSEEYYKVGSITQGEKIKIIADFNISFHHFRLIEYTQTSSGLVKSGYILDGLSI